MPQRASDSSHCPEHCMSTSPGHHNQQPNLLPSTIWTLLQPKPFSTSQSRAGGFTVITSPPSPNPFAIRTPSFLSRVRRPPARICSGAKNLRSSLRENTRLWPRSSISTINIIAHRHIDAVAAPPPSSCPGSKARILLGFCYNSAGESQP